MGFDEKRPPKRAWRGARIFAAGVLLLAAVFLLGGCGKSPAAGDGKLEVLRAHIWSDPSVWTEISDSLREQSGRRDFYAVFLSVSDGKTRAAVFHGTGKTPEDAWKEADRQTRAYLEEKEMAPLWVKADLVDSVETKTIEDFNREVAEAPYQNFFRKGIALDPAFQTAFLEAEVNGNKLLTYYTAEEKKSGIDFRESILHERNLAHYLENYYGLQLPGALPESVLVFTARGFFCDENDAVYELSHEGLDYGQRLRERADGAAAKEVMLRASEYLYGRILPDGAFRYLYYPVFDKTSESYNILRASGSIWSLINLYRVTGDGALLPKLDLAITALIDNYIEYPDENTAYVIERKSDEVKLGGNGLAVIMLTEYMSVFDNQRYYELVQKLANGILALENQEDGSYYHVLNFPDYSPKEEFRTIYYDGEATFALTRAYTLTGDESYLNAARAAVEHFIAEDYTSYRDHWVAYSMNEITKYIPDPRYFDFALRNASENLKRIASPSQLHPTYLELLMAVWQTLQRAEEQGIHTEIIDNFDKKAFAQTVDTRVRKLFTGVFTPEIAMYMKNPPAALGSFFIREDNFRVRIDDIQHFIGGFYFYQLYYDELAAYL
jgi:hypothetical protein